MNWDAIGAVGEIAGAIAVVASLFYVGRQVRENSKATKGQTFQSLIELSGTLLSNVVSDPTYGEISRKVFADEALTEDQYHRYGAQFFLFIRLIESAFYQRKLGLIDDEQLESFTSTLKAHLTSKAGSENWASIRRDKPEEFRKFIDSYGDSQVDA